MTALKKELEEARSGTKGVEDQLVVDTPTEALKTEIIQLRKLLGHHEQRESEEKARRIAVEAKLVRLKARYDSLVCGGFMAEKLRSNILQRSNQLTEAMYAMALIMLKSKMKKKREIYFLEK